MPPSLNLAERRRQPIERQRDSHLIDALVEAIGSVPTASVEDVAYEVGGGSSVHDAEVKARIGHDRLSLLIDTRAQVYPRDARDRIARWEAFQASARTGRPRQLVLAAEFISTGAKQLLASAGIGYFAAGGSLCLPGPAAFIYIDRPPAARAARLAGAVFAGARARVLHAVLLWQDEWHTVQDLANRTGASMGTVSNLLQQLEQLEWVRTRGQGPFKSRQLVEPGAVLTAWATHVSATKVGPRRFYAPGLKAMDLPLRIGHLLQNSPCKYEVTGEAAAQHYAPFLTSIPVATVRALPDVVEELVRSLGAKEVVQGANLHLIESSSAGDFFLNSEAEISYATPVRTYLDLVAAPGRAKEAAEHLREQVLKY